MSFSGKIPTLSTKSLLNHWRPAEEIRWFDQIDSIHLVRIHLSIKQPAIIIDYAERKSLTLKTSQFFVLRNFFSMKNLLSAFV